MSTHAVALHFEPELISKIDAGEISFLTIGKIDKYENSKHDLQHYVVA